jgi:hypothetical protein
MKPVLFAAAAAALALSAVTAQAQVGTGSAGESAAVAPAAPTQVAAAGAAKRGAHQSTTGDPNKQICRKHTATGSRIASAKICKTAREWDEQREAAKAELDRHQRSDGTNGF